MRDAGLPAYSHNPRSKGSAASVLSNTCQTAKHMTADLEASAGQEPCQCGVVRRTHNPPLARPVNRRPGTDLPPAIGRLAATVRVTPWVWRIRAPLGECIPPAVRVIALQPTLHPVQDHRAASPARVRVPMPRRRAIRRRVPRPACIALEPSLDALQSRPG
jgi:hypothetical protein